MSGVYHRPSGIGTQDFSLCPGMILRLPPVGIGVISRGCFVGGEPRPKVRQYFFLLFLISLCLLSLLLTPCFLFCAVKRRLKLKSRYKERVEKAIQYAESIENWDNLVDPQTLAFYHLGPDPSFYVLRTLAIEVKKSKY